MKTGFFIAVAAALFHLALSIPAPAIDIVLAVVMEEVQIYVDQKGHVLKSSVMFSTIGATASSSPIAAPIATTPAAAPAFLAKHSSTSSSLVTPSTPPKPPASSSPAAPASPPASSSSSGSAGTGSGFQKGIAYSPYSSSGCKTAEEVASDVGQLTSYNVIRIYGTDCNQVANVMAAIKGTNVKLFAGIFDVGQVSAETQSMISQIGGNWAAIDTISVGNEAVEDGTSSVAQVTAAVGTARTLLRAAGYSGPVVTVDTMVAMKANMELCEASDYCAFNCHAFFDGKTAPANAGTFVQSWVTQISALSNGKRCVVTESGWPTAGSRNGIAVPSPENQQIALSSLKAAFPANLILYSAFDNTALPNSAATFNAEQHCGITGGSGA